MRGGLIVTIGLTQHRVKSKASSDVRQATIKMREDGRDGRVAANKEETSASLNYNATSGLFSLYIYIWRLHGVVAGQVYNRLVLLLQLAGSIWGAKVRGAGHACLTNANINEEHNTTD